MMHKLIIVSLILFSSVFYGENISIAVLNLDAKNVEVEKAELVSERISIQLFKSGHYKVIERERLSQITKEQQLQLSGLTGSEYTSKLGEILSAQHLLLGSIYYIDDQYIINIRILDVESGQYIKVADQQSSDFSSLYAAIPRLIDQLLNSSANEESNRFNLENSINLIKQNISEGLGTKLEKRLENITKKIDNQTQSGDILEDKKESSSAPPQPSAKSQNKKSRPALFDVILDTKYQIMPFTFDRFSLSGNFFHVGASLLYNVNPLFSIGIGGYNAFSLNEFNLTNNLNLAYGGVQGRFKINFWRLGLGISILGGVGHINVTERSTVLYSETYESIYSSTFIILDTKGTLSFKVSKVLSIGLNVDYMWSTQYDPGEDIKGLQAGISLIFTI